MNYNPTNLKFIKWGLFAIVVSVLLTTCGVKAPPVPSDYEPPPAITDLGYTLTADGSVELSWSLSRPGEGSQGRQGAGRKGVSIQRQPGETCMRKKCPRIFSPWSGTCPWSRVNCFSRENRCKKGFR